MREPSTKSSAESGLTLKRQVRMVPVRTLFASASAIVLGLAAFVGAAAQPQLPATYFGSVTIAGEPAAAGIEVRGFVGGVDCSQSAPGEHVVVRDGAIAVYVLHVVHESQRPGCAKDGAPVSFLVDGKPAIQTAPFKVGPNRLDLSLGSAPPIPLPSATGTTAAVIQTATSGTPIPGASPTTLTRPTGTPPTDDVRFDSTLPGRSIVPSGPGILPGDSDDGSSLWVVVMVCLGILALAAGAAGLFLARRPRNAEGKDET